MWYKEWFDCEYYHILYCHRDDKEAEAFLHRLVGHLKLQPGMRIFDLPCGRGRHSVFLEKEGYNVTGADLSSNSIAFAKQFETSELHFRVHNMLEPFPEKDFDAVMNLFTSLGYFDRPEEDQKALQHMADALKSDGFLIVDFLNPLQVEKNLIPEETRKIDGIIFELNKKIDNKNVIKTVRFRNENKDFEYSEKVHLYSRDELCSMVNATGLQIINTFGDYHLGPHTEESERCIVVARKS
ncbi:MAG TPA: SAM-dependent methyltransferase [Flavobacteriales bacterium]|nr:SAM-dependent methyltransferase [Flavobacteriales bacterium]